MRCRPKAVYLIAPPFNFIIFICGLQLQNSHVLYCDVWQIGRAVVYSFNRNCIDVHKQVGKIYRNHCFTSRLVELTILDIEAVLGNTGKVARCACIAAREAVDDNAVFNRCNDFIESLVALWHCEESAARLSAWKTCL